jgi:hypothetical protein
MRHQEHPKKMYPKNLEAVLEPAKGKLKLPPLLPLRSVLPEMEAKPVKLRQLPRQNVLLQVAVREVKVPPPLLNEVLQTAANLVRLRQLPGQSALLKVAASLAIVNPDVRIIEVWMGFPDEFGNLGCLSFYLDMQDQFIIAGRITHSYIYL